VQWCKDSGFSGCSGNTSNASSASFTHSTVLADGTWYLRVLASDAVSNNSSYSSNGSVVVDTTAPSVPTNLTSTLIADKQARLTWSAVSGASSYKVYKSTTNNSSGFTNVGTPTNANYDADMNCDRHWFYVTSLDSVSNESAASSTTEILPNCPSTSTSSTSSGSSTSTSTTTTTASPSPSLSSQLETGNWKLETEEETNGPIIPKLSLPKELAKIPQLVEKAGFLKRFFAYVLRAIRDVGQYLAARFGDGLAYVSDKLAQVAIYFGGNIKGSKTDLAQVPKLQITDVGITKLSSTAVIINWKTNKEATSKVNFGLDTSYGNDAQDTDLVKEHSLTLGNLQPDETYYFEVMSQVGNDYVYDAYYTFTTRSES